MTDCSVVDCDRRASTTVVLHQRETYGATGGIPVCDEHNFAMSVDGAPWANMPDRGGILLGQLLDDAGLLLVDGASSDMDVDRYVSGLGGVPRLLINGRVHGSGTPRTVEVLLTPDAAKLILDAVQFWARRDDASAETED